MIIALQIIFALLLLRAIFSVCLGVCQMVAAGTALLLAAGFYAAATLLHWLVLLWVTAFPKQN